MPYSSKKPVSGEVPGYADGGEIQMPPLEIPVSSFDVVNPSTPAAGTYTPPPAAPEDYIAKMYREHGVEPPGAAVPAPAPQTAAAVNRPPVPVPTTSSAHPTPALQLPTVQDVLSQGAGLGSELYGGYTPERRNELYAALLQRQNGMGNVVGGALASVGDAIARGYGKGGSDFLNKVQDQERQNRQDALDAFDSAQKGHLSMHQAGMELAKIDPRSPISKLTVASYGPILVNKLGYTPQQVANMSAAQVEAVAKVGADYGGKELENLFHQAQLIVEAGFHQQELGMRGQEVKAGALKELASHPIASLLPTATNQALKQQAGLTPQTTGQQTTSGIPHFATEAEAQAAHLPDGTPIVVNGVSGTWRHK